MSKRRPEARLYAIYTTICAGIQAKKPLKDLCVEMGLHKSAMNEHVMRMKLRGYLAGDGRRRGGMTVQRMPSADEFGEDRTPHGKARKISEGVLNSNARRADGFDPDLHYLLRELADPRGAHDAFLFPPAWISKARALNYIRVDDAGRAALTAAGAKAAGVTEDGVLKETKLQKLRRAKVVSEQLASLLADLILEFDHDAT